METDGVGALSGVPTINLTLCSGCGRCVAACPAKIITLETVRFHKHAVISPPEHCSHCDSCVKSCPIAALHRSS